jgi:hypothetical protein
VRQQPDLDRESEREGRGHRRQDQAQAQVGTLVAVGSSFGGVSKVCQGAGDGTSHSSPSAASHGRCGAFSPWPRSIGSTTKTKKYTCIRPNPSAPTEAIALKSANCIG